MNTFKITLAGDPYGPFWLVVASTREKAKQELAKLLGYDPVDLE